MINLPVKGGDGNQDGHIKMRNILKTGLLYRFI